jgi:iron complex outermembrane receptor protein
MARYDAAQRREARMRIGIAAVLAGAMALPAAATPPVTLPPVQVTATRTPNAPARTPAAIAVLDAETLRDARRDAALAEKLAVVPGVFARQRNNYAQDEQLSIRGFGARATFGIRGVRVFVDGVPATMPDGQGQVSHVNLGAAQRIEVLRGPFSALYGNAAGGVVQVFGADGRDAPGASASLRVGAHGTRRLGVRLAGGDARIDYRLDASRFETDGYRDHSRARRDSLDGKLDVAFGEAATLRLVLNAFDSPDTEDPLGLDRAQLEADPRSVVPAALAFDTRKSVRQHQLGAVLAGRDERWRVLAYTGERRVVQYLSIPTFVQAPPTHAGGVIDLRSPYRGVDARWTQAFADGRWTLVTGVAADRQDQHRRGYENFAGGTLGVRGRLRRDEVDRVADADLYAQVAWRPNADWDVHAGVRRSRVRFRAEDAYVAPGNPDDSGELRFSATNPVLGASWHVRPGLHLFAAAGRGLETPTFDELGYRPDGGAGLNFSLRPARTRSVELGAKFEGAHLAGEAVLFRADTDDELAVAANSGGRSSFHNVGAARRQGLELSARVPVGDTGRVQLAYTWLDATTRDAFPTCAGAPCPVPNATVPAGTRLPGLPRSVFALQGRWGRATGAFAGGGVQAVSSVPVATLGGQRAAGYAIADAHVGYAFATPRLEGRVFAAIENLADRRHVGSVIVNEANGRYFEPGSGRTFLVGGELRFH